MSLLFTDSVVTVATSEVPFVVLDLLNWAVQVRFSTGRVSAATALIATMTNIAINRDNFFMLVVINRKWARLSMADRNVAEVYSVRLKSRVARLMARAVKQKRNMRSPLVAARPVFFRMSCLNP